MREYIRPGFAQEQQEQELQKLNAILQALRNSHKALATIHGGEERDFARQSIADAFEQITALKLQKEKSLSNSLPAYPTVDVSVEADLGWDTAEALLLD